MTDPRFDASTVGLAYSKEPEDATTAGEAYPLGLVGDAGQLAVVDHTDAYPDAADITPGYNNAQQGRKPFLLAGSSLTALGDTRSVTSSGHYLRGCDR